MIRLGSVGIGGSNPTRIVGILNASPESFLRSSVSTTPQAISRAAARMEAEGADIIDIGGMSSAPYAATMVPEGTEVERVAAAVRAAVRSTDVPISVDTCRGRVAEAAISEGASIVNDITGLRHDERMRDAVRAHSPSLIVCAHSETRLAGGEPVAQAAGLLADSLRTAASCGVPASQTAIDPAIGFFRRTGRGSLFTRNEMDWVARDLLVLGGLQGLRAGTRSEILVSVSNKSFLGLIMGGAEAGERMAGSLAAEVVAVANGAAAIRTHNVAKTREALAALQGSVHA